jgi:GntR family transcriptional regulator
VQRTSARSRTLGQRLSSTVRDELADRIASREIPPGSRLPPEPAFAAELGVSRATLRDALRSLEEDGLLSRTRGAGTFVTGRPRLRNNLGVNFGVTEAIRRAGMEPGCEEAQVVTSVAKPDEARRLALPPLGEVVVIERVRTADRRPVVFSRDVVDRAVLAADLSPLQRIGDGSLYEILERQYGVVVHHGVASVRPVKADRALANRLRVAPGALCVYVRQLDYDPSGRCVIYSHEFHLADAFEFSVVRRGPGRRHS